MHLLSAQLPKHPDQAQSHEYKYCTRNRALIAFTYSCKQQKHQGIATEERNNFNPVIRF